MNRLIQSSPRSKKQNQTGSVLLEALISIVIFSMGILAIIGLQAASVRASSDAKYRTEAGFFANELIGRMWVSDRTPATLKANYAGISGTGGTLYTEWAGNLSSPAAGTVMADLPNARIYPPNVVIDTISNTHQSSKVTITIFWKLPGESTIHQYQTIAQIS